jgi:hypothetical protein
VKARVLVLSVLAAAGCVSSPKHVVHLSGSTSTETITETPTVTVPRDRVVAPLAPGAKPAAGEVERTCPYIKAGLNAEPTDAPNVADIVGSHVYRVTVLTKLHPAGCRFYFYGPPYQPIADIQAFTYGSHPDAHNALALAARRGSDQETRLNFVPGVDGVLYRTAFVRGDGRQDWAFAFAKGKVLVVVHTQRSDPASLVAFLLGKAVVGRF